MSEVPALYGQYDDEGNPLWMDGAVRQLFALRAALEMAQVNVTVLRSEINRITGDFNALGAERDSARALLKLAFQELVIGRQNYTLRGRIAAELEK